MSDEQANCIFRNQIEIMSALSLLLRYAAPNLIGRDGELDRQRNDLHERYVDTVRNITVTSGDRNNG